MLIIVADLLPWHSNHSGFDLGLLIGFIYWFPLIGGLIILVGVILGFVIPRQQIATVLLQFFGLSLELMFLVDYLGINLQFLNNVQAGFYSLIIGICVVFLDIIGTLLSKRERVERIR